MPDLSRVTAIGRCMGADDGHINVNSLAPCILVVDVWMAVIAVHPVTLFDMSGHFRFIRNDLGQLVSHGIVPLENLTAYRAVKRMPAIDVPLA